MNGDIFFLINFNIYDMKHLRKFNESSEPDYRSSNFKVVFDGFETEEQAKSFAKWYEGQGEQDSEYWLSASSDLQCAHVDMCEYHKRGGFNANENGEVIVPLRLYKK